MGYTFRPAVREQVTLLIGLVGASGSGKTYSAMRLASGMVGKSERFAVIDTEARRSLHYADMFNFDMAELHPPFRPSAYTEAIKTADDAGYKVIVVDSISHEWAGESGILDWQEEELTRMAGDDYRKRESCKMASWIKPKMGHKQMVQRMLQIKANLILCFRAEEKIGMEKDRNGKMVIVPKGWQPICEKSLPYELTVSFLLTPDKPGYPQPIKLQEQHKTIFPLDKPINEESGLKVSEWARGGKPKTEPSEPTEIKEPQPKGSAAKPSPQSQDSEASQSKNFPATDKQKRMIWAGLKKVYGSDDEAKKTCIIVTGKESSKDWTNADVQNILEQLDLDAMLEDKDEEKGSAPTVLPPRQEKDLILDMLRSLATEPEHVDAMCEEGIGKKATDEWTAEDVDKMREYAGMFEKTKEAA